MEGLAEHELLPVDVRYAPEQIAVTEVRGIENGLDSERCRVLLAVRGRCEHSHGVPLRHEERHLPRLLPCVSVEFGQDALAPCLIFLGMEEHIAHIGGQTALILCRILGKTEYAEDILERNRIAKGIAGIVMGGEEVAGNIFASAEFPELFQSAARGGGWPAHTECAVHLFYSMRRRLIETEVVLLLALEKDTEVGLVPRLKIPAFDLLLSIAMQEKAQECLDKSTPLFKRFGLCDVVAITQTRSFAACERRGHEGEFDKRLHAASDHIVIHLGDLQKVDFRDIFAVWHGLKKDCSPRAAARTACRRQRCRESGYIGTRARRAQVWHARTDPCDGAERHGRSHAELPRKIGERCPAVYIDGDIHIPSLRRRAASLYFASIFCILR